MAKDNNPNNKKITKILFVCLGNICRSPAAEGIFRDIVEREHATESFEIDSAGIGRWHQGQLPDRRMIDHARHRGLLLTHRARQVRYDDFDRFDMIIGMDSSNISDLRQLAPTLEAARKITPISRFFDSSIDYDHVPDPYYEGSEGFEIVLDLLEKACYNLYLSLIKSNQK